MINDHTFITQEHVLKLRYDKQTTFLDRLARFYGNQNAILKIGLKYLSIGLTVLSFFSLSMLATFGMMFLTAFIFFLDEHDQLMETRFYQLSHDLEVSEKQLQQAVAQNIELVKQFAQAVQKNQIVSNVLGKIKEEAIHLREQILEKEQVIETTRVELEESLTQIKALLSETMKIKKDVSERAVQFSKQVAFTEKMLKGLFCRNPGISDELKESCEFQEKMDGNLNI